MTKIKCKISDLVEICNLVSMKGKNPQGKDYVAVPDFMITATVSPPELVVSSTDSKNALALQLTYKVESVVEDGDISISDVEKFMKYLERFNSDDVVIVEATPNRVIITRELQKKVARIPTGDSESSETKEGGEKAISRFPLNKNGYPKSEKTHLSLKIVLDAGDMKKVIDDGGVVNQRDYPWVVQGEAFSINVGSEALGEIETTIKTDKIELDPEVAGGTEPGNVARTHMGTKTRFSYGLDNLFSTLDGKVDVFVAEKVDVCPLYLIKRTDKYELKAVLAPVMTE